MLRNLNTGTTTTRNERDIRKFPGNANQTADTPNNSADTDKVITGIMKQDECMKAPESIERADDAEPCGSGRVKESTDQVMKIAHAPESGVCLDSACALKVNPNGCISC